MRHTIPNPISQRIKPSAVKRSAAVIAALACVLLMSSCDSRINKMADTDLQDRMYECRDSLSQNPGFAISCDNYRRECLRRREQGKFLC